MSIPLLSSLLLHHWSLEYIDLDFIQIPTTTHLTINNIYHYYNNNLNVKSILLDIPCTTAAHAEASHKKIACACIDNDCYYYRTEESFVRSPE